MKTILLFIFSFFLGIILVLGYNLLFPGKKSAPVLLPISPTITTKFSLEEAPDKSLRGTIISYSGIVDWQSRTATQPAKLTELKTIQQGEALTTGDDGKVTLQIPGVASISALPNSTINFIQTLPENLVIEQNSGSASYRSDGKTPISIRSFDLLTIVQNGMVTVSVDKNQHISTVTVQKGSVTEGFNDTQNLSNVITVAEGYQFIFNNDKKSGFIQ